MKILLVLLLLMAGHAHAQTSGALIRRDSLPDDSPADRMPNARPSNSFYRDPRDPKNVVRATLDNMPVRVPDSAVNYKIMQSKQRYHMPMPGPNALRRKE